MPRNVLFQHLQMPLFKPHPLLHLHNLLLLRLIIHPRHSTELQPSVILLLLSKLPQNYVNPLPILAKHHIVWNAQLNQLICHQSEHKWQRIRNLWWVVVWPDRTQHKSVTHRWVNLLNPHPHTVQVNLLFRIHQRTAFPLDSLLILNR